MITTENLRDMAELAKLEMDDKECQYALNRISTIFQHMRQLPELDLTNVAPTTHVLRQANVFRDDIAAPCLPREEALSIAPESEGGYFKVPSIL